MRRLLLSLLLALTLIPSPAAADFHFVSVREVFPGEAGWLDAEYVEMQAYATGQNFVSNHSVTFYNAAGMPVDTEPFTKDVDDGRSQMTFVMATAAAESRFGFTPDAVMEPNLVNPAGGAICWAGVDCVSWGSFPGTLAGSPAEPAGIPDGMALRRTIAPGCATMLESGDDRNNSALDFSAVLPAPRPNSTPPSETVCGAGGGGAGTGGGGSEAGEEAKGGQSAAPQTKLRSRPPARTLDRTPTFRFGSGEGGVSFECKLDRKPFRTCRSAFTARRLSFGRHTFQVRARDASGQADRTPAFDSFRVVRRLP
ncbi:MAG: hypothetical protein WA687_05505 [Solirubrobacterales bacterium]